MFESFVTNLKNKFRKKSVEIPNNTDSERTGFKRSLHNLKTKFLKSDAPELMLYNNYSDTALSPRAIGTAECAETDIEWPTILDNNPDVLDKFTRIITITQDAPYDRKVQNYMYMLVYYVCINKIFMYFAISLVYRNVMIGKKFGKG